MACGTSMLNQWLESERRKAGTFGYFEVLDLTERKAPTGDVKEHLSALLRESALDLAFLEDATRRLGWSKAEAMVRLRLPAQARARRGRFGEVVGVFILHEFEGYVVPIEKAHFAITGGQSQPSTDAVLLRMDGSTVAEVCFVESKLRTRPDNFSGVEGERQLRADHRKDVPDMLTFTAARLYERADPLYDAFMDYLASRDDEQDRDTFRLSLFYDAAIWSERCLENLEDEAPEAQPLTVQAIRVSALRNLVDEIFDRVEMEVVDDEP